MSVIKRQIQKIAIVTSVWELEVGTGAALMAQLLAKAMVDKGIGVVVITSHAKRTLRVEESDGLRIWRLPSFNCYWIGHKDVQPVYKKVVWQIFDTWNPATFIFIKNILGAEQPDLVHVHKLRGLSPAVWTAAYHAGITSIVQTVHDYEVISPEGTLTKKFLGVDLSQLAFIRPYRWLRRKAARHVKVVTAPSKRVMDILKEYSFFSNAEKFIVPNTHGWTLEELAERKRALSVSNIDNTLRFLYVGNLVEYKGIYLLCEAFVKAANDHGNIVLEIVGGGPAYNRIKQKYGNHSQIILHGPLFGQAKEEISQRCDAFVLPSLWEEPFGIVIAEAFTYGKPCIVSSIGALPELVIDGVNGFLFPPGNREVLYQLFCRFAQNPNELRNKREHAFASAESVCVERVIERYWKVYETAITYKNEC